MPNLLKRLIAMAKATITRKIGFLHVPKDGADGKPGADGKDGQDGKPGADGTSVTITRHVVMYCVQESGTELKAPGWSRDIPEVPSGMYLWTRTAVEYSDGTETISYSVSRNASDGLPGKTYKPMRIRDWDGIASGETLYEGSGDDDPWTDMVVTRTPEAYYRVVQRFAVPSAKGQPSDAAYQGKLQTTSQFKALATDLFLAKEAFIRNLVVNKLVTSALSGERVVIDPEQKDMRIFNASGDLVATYGAKSRTAAEVVPPDTVSGANSASATALGMSFGTITDDRTVSAGGLQEHFKSGTVSREVSHGAVSGNGMLKVKIPAYTVTYRPVNKQLPYMTSVSCRLWAELSVNGKAVETRQIYSGGYGTYMAETTQSVTFGASLKAGDSYKVSVRLFYELGGGTDTGSTLDANAQTGMEASYVADFYRSEYFGNGFAFSTNSRNYFYALFEDNELKIKAVSGGTVIFSS